MTAHDMLRIGLVAVARRTTEESEGERVEHGGFARPRCSGDGKETGIAQGLFVQFDLMLAPERIEVFERDAEDFHGSVAFLLSHELAQFLKGDLEFVCLFHG